MVDDSKEFFEDLHPEDAERLRHAQGIYPCSTMVLYVWLGYLCTTITITIKLNFSILCVSCSGHGIDDFTLNEQGWSEDDDNPQPTGFSPTHSTLGPLLVAYLIWDICANTAINLFVKSEIITTI